MLQAFSVIVWMLFVYTDVLLAYYCVWTGYVIIVSTLQEP